LINIESQVRFLEVISALKKHTPKNIDQCFRFVGSGKAGIGLVLSYLAEKQILENKMSEIIVPPWMGTWVYSSMLPFCYPVLQSNTAKVAWCYHQFGFPQNLDKFMNIAIDRNLIVVEDCAHSIFSSYNGKKLGSFGDFSIYSYSKFHFCFTLGGVSSEDNDFMNFVDKLINNAPFKLRIFHTFSKLLSSISSNSSQNSATFSLTEMSYAGYYRQPSPSKIAIKMWANNQNLEFDKRQENYSIILNEMQRFGLCSGLEKEGVVPYAVPLNIKSDKIESVIEKLKQIGIVAIVRQFDINRCLFDPNYQSRVILPIHSGVTSNIMDKIVTTLKEVHK
jgi:hypothetical protein